MRKLKNKTVLADLPPFWSWSCAFLPGSVPLHLVGTFLPRALLGSWSTIVCKRWQNIRRNLRFYLPVVSLWTSLYCTCCFVLHLNGTIVGCFWPDFFCSLSESRDCILVHLLHFNIALLLSLHCIGLYNNCIHILLKTEMFSARTLRGPE